MKIGLIGFGKAGKMVAEEILKDHELTLQWVLKRTHHPKETFASDLFGYEPGQGKIYSIQSVNLETFFENHFVDVMIDFSSPESAHIYQHAVKIGIKIVSAISNYEDKQYLDLKRLSKQSAILHSPNITIGINLLISMTKALQSIIPEADIEIIEEHFRDKKDISGTARRIAKNLGLDESKHVNSIRAGGIVGRHEIVFGLMNQTIRVVHESISRAAFGEGAIYAAKWIHHKKNGFYTMEEAMSMKKNEKMTTELIS